jgi:hypothetical protein
MRNMFSTMAAAAMLVAGTSSLALAQYQSYGYQQPGYGTYAQPGYGYQQPAYATPAPAYASGCGGWNQPPCNNAAAGAVVGGATGAAIGAAAGGGQGALIGGAAGAALGATAGSTQPAYGYQQPAYGTYGTPYQPGYGYR